MIVKRVGRVCPFLLACTLAVSTARAQEPIYPPVDELIKQLSDPDPIVRSDAVWELWRIGPHAVPVLIEALEDKNGSVRANVARALSRIGVPASPAVPALIEALKDDDPRVRASVAQTLGVIGPDATAAVPALIKALKDDDTFVRQFAAHALGDIGPEAKPAVPALIEALEDRDHAVRMRAAGVLGMIGPDAKAAVPTLIQLLKDEHPFVRDQTIRALGSIGAHAKDAVRGLIEILKHEDVEARRRAGWALKRIAVELQDAKDISALPDLEKALPALTSAGSPHDTVVPVTRAVEALRVIAELERQGWTNELLQRAQKHPWISAIVLIELALLALWLAFFWLHPATLLGVNNALDRFFNEKLKFTIKGFEGSALPKFLLLVGFFHYHRRVLDAWVGKHIKTARKGFNANETVALRQTHVPVPVFLDGKSLPGLGPEQLSHACNKGRWRVLIRGEGGAGKTSWACQMAHWAMADDKPDRLCRHRMLPILIEQELDLTLENPRHRFQEALRGQLQDLVTEDDPEAISTRLLAHLLKKQRILVIVDHLSEMSEDTRQAMRPGDPEFLPNALVITSRIDERLDGVTKTVIEPRRIDGNRLSSFMESYLTHTKKRELFDDAEYFDACRNLSLLVAERDITVLLAKLYADQMVAVKEGAADDSLPDNIPDLMLQYVKILTRGATEDDPDTAEVQAVAKVIAWECMSPTFRPGPALRKDIVIALEQASHAKEHLHYLEHRLRIVRTAGVSDEKVLFELDPLAEYLAGLHLVDLHRDDSDRWNQFLANADAQPGAPQSIKGFLLAVRDACLANKQSLGPVFDFVVEQLARRTGLDPEAVKKAHLQQRIQRLITQLSVPEPEDRRAAAEALANIGPDAKPAVPALIEALKDQDFAVRTNAARALSKMGPDAKPAIPALIDALRDDQRFVRRSAVNALVTIAGDEIGARIAALRKQDQDGHHVSADLRWKMGEDAKAVIAALHAALKDQDARVRNIVAEALWELGANPEGPVIALTATLKNGDKYTRLSAASLLGSMGSHAIPAVPELIELLTAYDEEVRCAAAVALGRMGPDAKAAVPALVEGMKDAALRPAAGSALTRIRGEDETTE